MALPRLIDVASKEIKEIRTEKVVEVAPSAYSKPSFFSKESLLGFAPMAAVLAIFYFFIIRPQAKRQKERILLVNSLKKGDKVLTGGGIKGTVVQVKDESTLIVEIAKGVNVELTKSSVVPEAPVSDSKSVVV